MQGEIVCKNCDNKFIGHYCNQCGQESDVGKFTMKNIGHEFLHGFYHVNGGMLYTMKELILRPGELIRDYLVGKRVAYSNPFTFLLVVSLIGGFLMSHSGMLAYSRFNIFSTAETMEFATKHFSYRMLTTIPVYSVIFFFLYRKYKYNFAEHLVMATFLVGQTTFISILWLLAGNLVMKNELNVSIILNGNYVTILAFQVIAIYGIFNTDKTWIRVLKAILAVAAAFFIAFTLLNVTTDFVSRHWGVVNQ